MLLCLCNWDKEKTFFHEWIGFSAGKNNSKRIKLLESVYPNMKTDEIELLAEINSSADLKDLARQIGWDEKELKNL
jgi:hypothetical protein